MSPMWACGVSTGGGLGQSLPYVPRGIVPKFPVECSYVYIAWERRFEVFIANQGLDHTISPEAPEIAVISCSNDAYLFGHFEEALVTDHCFISLDCRLLLSICVIFRCVLHPLPLPLSSCLGCIPPLIGLPSLRFYAVGSSLFLLSVCFCLCSLFYRDDVLCWLLLARPFLYAFHAHLRFPVDLVWFRLSCDHGWIRSGSVNVRKQQQQQQQTGMGAHFRSDCWCSF